MKRIIRKILKKISKDYRKESNFRSKYCAFCAKDLLLKESSFIHPIGPLYIGCGSKLLCWSKYAYRNEIQTLEPSLKIGNNFHATRNLTIQCAGEITIGDDVLMASDVLIINYNHGTDPAVSSYLDNPLEVSTVRIEDGVWIGNNVIILPGVKIGKKSIIGAGSVVTKDVPEYSIAVGNPARIIKHYDFNKQKWCKID